MILGGASTAGAATITVDTAVDQAGAASSCSLRNAVIAADQDVAAGGCAAGSGDDLIEVPPGSYELSLSGADENLGVSGDLDLRGPGAVTIEPSSAAGGVVIDGLNLDRVIHLAGGSLALRDMTLTHGSSIGTVDPYGGAIYVSSGALTLDGVLVRDSRSELGGALYNGGNANLVNSTLSGNRATTYGGGIVAAIGSQTVLRSVTVAFNHADSDASGDGDGGGLFAPSESVEMTNSILADNLDDSPTGNLSLPDCTAGSGFQPRFVISTQDLGCHLGADPGVSNQSPADPLLLPLADNDGPTFTHALGTGSPALNAGGATAPDQCPATDQRGRTRPAGECDLGAYEFVPKPPDPDPDPDPEPLPGMANPTKTTATYDGKNLHIRLKCPARFKPKCISTAVPVTKRKGGKAMAKLKKVVTRANGWKRVTFLIKPAFRQKVMAMTFVDRKQLVTRQKIKSKRVGKRRAKRPATVFHTYKVRVKA
ncbi:MAG: hypothetical protein J0H98_04965 [Solirubrobacterales bacterium]|nr:hypothetical protein [Solirubrobacterales bacterium]